MLSYLSLLISIIASSVMAAEPAVVRIKDREATIEWTTTLKYFGQIAYGSSPLLGNQAKDNTFATGHTITLKNLKPKTLYFFRVIEKSWEEKKTESAIYSFTTAQEAVELTPTALQILGRPAVDALPNRQVTITWTTNKSSRGMITYGHKHQKKPYVYLSDADLTLHSAILNNLIPDTLYYFQVTAVDKKGKTVKSNYISFRTPKTQTQQALPSISEGPSVAFRRAQEIKIEWTSDRPCKSAISWGKIPLSQFHQKKMVSDQFATTHSIVLKNLKPNTRYYYIIYLEDEVTRKKKSQIFSIRTDQQLSSGALRFPDFI